MKTDKKPANTDAQPRKYIRASIDNVVDLTSWRNCKDKICATAKILPSTHVLLTCGPTA